MISRSNTVHILNPLYFCVLKTLQKKERLVHASTAVEGKLYVFGGCGTRGQLSTAEVYDPTSDSWVHGLSSTSGRESAVAVAL